MSKLVNAAAVTFAWRALEARENWLQELPLCAKVLAVSKGQSAIVLELKESFKKSSARVLLVDWVCGRYLESNQRQTIHDCSPSSSKLETPEVFSLELGITQKMQGWIAQFWQGGPRCREQTQSCFLSTT